MKNRFLVGAGVALAVTLGGAAGAQAQFLALPSGGAFYIGGEGGWTWLNDQTLHPSGTFSNALGGRSKKENFSGGPAIGVRAGYEWGPWRLEEEFAYRINGIDSIGGIGVDGNRINYSFMTNLIAGTNQWFNFGWPVDPYIGFGIGAAILHEGWSAGPFTGQVRTPFGVVTGAQASGTWVSSTSTQFAYQGIAGIRYNINPSLAFDIDYRYFATTQAKFNVNRGKGWRVLYVGQQLKQLAGLSRRQVRRAAAASRCGTPCAACAAAGTAQGVPRVLRLGQVLDHA